MTTTVVFGVLVVIGACLAAVAGLELVQRLVPHEKRQEHNDVAGFLYAVIGVVYAVLLALLVIAVWQQYEKANETVESEANGVAEVAWLAHRLPEPEHHQLQEDARSYAQEVVDQEWPQMEQGLGGGCRAFRRGGRLRAAHGGRAGAIRRRARSDFEVWGR
jgi:hypothetical protein